MGMAEATSTLESDEDADALEERDGRGPCVVEAASSPAVGASVEE